jgi:(2Fe-2S) ferredoxin
LAIDSIRRTLALGRIVDLARAGCQRAPMPQRQRYLFVCTNHRPSGHEKGCCAERGGEAVHAALKERLKTRGLAKLQARVCTASCLDQCSIGVTVLVEPDHFFYGRVTVADVEEIVDALERGGRVERLVASSADLAKG